MAKFLYCGSSWYFAFLHSAIFWPWKMSTWKKVSRRRMTSGLMEIESRSTGWGSTPMEYDVKVGWIMVNELLTSSRLSTCLTKEDRLVLWLLGLLFRPRPPSPPPQLTYNMPFHQDYYWRLARIDFSSNGTWTVGKWTYCQRAWRKMDHPFCSLQTFDTINGESKEIGVE